MSICPVRRPLAREAYQYDVAYHEVTVTTDGGLIPDKPRPVVDQLTKLIA